MTNYALPVNDKDISKAKTFYDLICWGGLLIVLLPVGIANVILGYFMGDSPCTLCWGCLLYTSPSPRDGLLSRMPSSA